MNALNERLRYHITGAIERGEAAAIECREHPTTDNECTRLGWIEAIATSDDGDLHISYPPGSYFDEPLRVFCHDEQEMILLAGWLFTFEPVAKTA